MSFAGSSWNSPLCVFVCMCFFVYVMNHESHLRRDANSALKQLVHFRFAFQDDFEQWAFITTKIKKTLEGTSSGWEGC